MHGKSYPLLSTKVEHSPFTVGNTRRNATLRNVSQSLFLRKEIALLPNVVGEFACYTSIYVFGTKRRTTRFKVRKALNNKFVCFYNLSKSIEIECLPNLLRASSCAKKINRDLKVSKSCFGKINAIHQNDSIVATRTCTVATKSDIRLIIIKVQKLEKFAGLSTVQSQRP